MLRGRGWRRGEILQVAWRDVEENLRLGGKDLDAEVFGCEALGQDGVVGDADVGAGVGAFMRYGDHDGETGSVDDSILAAVKGLAEAVRVRLAGDYVVWKDRFGDAGGEGEGCGSKGEEEGVILESSHGEDLLLDRSGGNLAVTDEVQNDPIVVSSRTRQAVDGTLNCKGLQKRR